MSTKELKNNSVTVCKEVTVYPSAFDLSHPLSNLLLMNEKTPGAKRQEQWRKREISKGLIKRFDRRVTESEYEALKSFLADLRKKHD